MVQKKSKFNIMKIAIIGYGKMGKEIKKIAQEKEHEIVFQFDVNNKDEFTVENLKKVDVAIEFTTPEAAYDNFIKCFEANVPIVSGTTGWLDKLAQIKEKCENEKQTFLYASNFSLGVNLFFKLNQILSKMMNNYPDYQIDISETHHIHKLDAPSGTAITLAEDIIKNVERKQKWTKNKAKNDEIHIESIRKGEINGIHNIKYDSSVDTIEISHSLKNRKSLALGALLAAEFVYNKKGFFTMDDLLGF